MCQESCLVNYAIQKIWKNGTKIISVSEERESRIKRLGKHEGSDGAEALFK